ncbi:MAG: hypothetical protein VR70_05010 [Rhodospirillaceae bacterium BRH_c57]|nr:MAG: hypothetical protein VR70_05010 [Rhodospirillaceae bacterium BRH_c57]
MIWPTGPVGVKPTAAGQYRYALCSGPGRRRAGLLSAEQSSPPVMIEALMKLHTTGGSYRNRGRGSTL